MIDFRYHLVSIIAIFFALAAGIVLGAGPLSDTIDDTLTDQTAALREENRNLHEQLETANEDTAYQEAFLQEVTPRLVSEQLTGERVAIIAMPGADEDVVAEVDAALESAGAESELTVSIDPTWTDPDSEPVLDQLATDLVSTGTELGQGNGYAHGATVLAAALLSAPVENGSIEEPAGTVNTTVVTAYEEAGLIQLQQDASAAPTLVVAVAGSVSGEDAEQRLGWLATLTTELRARSAGLVLTGPPATVDGGLLGFVRTEEIENVSTVDVANLPSGRVAVVFALGEQRQGESGHYGVVGEVDGALPPVPASTEGDGTPDDTSNDGSDNGADNGSDEAGGDQ